MTSIIGLFCHEVSLLRATTVDDRYGNAAKDWTTPRRRTSRARVAQRISEEIGDGREGRRSTWICYLPAGTDVTALDRVVWDGLTFEVKGRPNQAFDRHREHHVEVDLQIVEG